MVNYSLAAAAGDDDGDDDGRVGVVCSGNEEQRRVSYMDSVLPDRLHVLTAVPRLVQRLAALVTAAVSRTRAAPPPPWRSTRTCRLHSLTHRVTVALSVCVRSLIHH